MIDPVLLHHRISANRYPLVVAVAPIPHGSARRYRYPLAVGTRMAIDPVARDQGVRPSSVDPRAAVIMDHIVQHPEEGTGVAENSIVIAIHLIPGDRRPCRTK